MLYNSWFIDIISEVVPLILKFLRKTPKKLEYNLPNEVEKSRNDYIDRILKYCELHNSCCGTTKLKSEELRNFFSPPVKNSFLFCICSALCCSGKVYLFIGSGKSEPNFEGIGRSTLINKLIGIKLPYTKLIPFSKETLKNIEVNGINLNYTAQSGWKLISSDFAYLGVSNGELIVAPVKYEKYCYVWDLARHLLRSTAPKYNPYDQVESPDIRELVTNLYYKIHIKDIDYFYTNSRENDYYKVDKIIFLRRIKSDKPEIFSFNEIKNKRNVLKNLKESILISCSDNQKTSFWKISKDKLILETNRLISKIKHLPIAKEVVFAYKPIGKTETGSTPVFIYDKVVSCINFDSLNNAQHSNNIFFGIDEYNKRLYGALSEVSKIEILVRSGEKVFQDVGFWKYILNCNREITLDIKILNPESNTVITIQNSAYKDKTDKEFLKHEIEDNINVIKKIKEFFSSENPNVSIDYNTYNEEPDMRVTILISSDKRLIISPYVRNRRTGDNTLFVDIKAPPDEFIKAFEEKYYTKQT